MLLMHQHYQQPSYASDVHQPWENHLTGEVHCDNLNVGMKEQRAGGRKMFTPMPSFCLYVNTVLDTCVECRFIITPHKLFS